MDAPTKTPHHSNVRIEISRQVLTEIIRSGAVSVADIRCLDASSKQQVWQSCLESSSRGLRIVPDSML